MDKKFNQYEYQNAYNKEKYDRVTILVPSGKKNILKQMASESGMSMNEFILSRFPELR